MRRYQSRHSMYFVGKNLESVWQSLSVENFIGWRGQAQWTEQRWRKRTTTGFTRVKWSSKKICAMQSQGMKLNLLARENQHWSGKDCLKPLESTLMQNLKIITRQKMNKKGCTLWIGPLALVMSRDWSTWTSLFVSWVCTTRSGSFLCRLMLESIFAKNMSCSKNSGENSKWAEE